MHWKLAVAIAAIAPMWAAEPALRLRSPRIALDYDARMHARMEWLPAARGNIIAFDPAAQASIEANGWTLSEFRLDAARSSTRRADDPEFGPAQEGILTGSARQQERGYALEKRLRVLLPDRLPDVAIVATSYRNTGTRAIHIGQVWSQRIVLDRKLAEPDQPSYAFASFQGGAYKWGLDYAVIPLEPGFRQSNFQGLDDRTGPEGEGGGMPFIDVWAPGMGVALAHIEKVPQWVSLPVEVRADGKAGLGISEQPLAKFRQPEWLGPGETYQAVTTAIIFHKGDYYDALHNYGELLRARGIAIPKTSPKSAYEPYWKSWGFEFDFSVNGILKLLPELKQMGIRIANLDDGWFDWYGDWNVKRTPGKFPGGEADIKAFVRNVHEQGFKTGLWWYPLGVSAESRLAREHPELLVMDDKGGYPLDGRRVRQLCPAFEPARRHIAQLVRRFVSEWDFDGVYLDCTGLTAVPPCFNPAHAHSTPLEPFQSLSKVFELIDRELHTLKPDPWLEVCICAMPHSPYNMPFYPIANASDPLNPLQMRRRIKLEKAIRGPEFCVGDCYQVPLREWTGSSIPESFESAMGAGAQVTTFYAELTAPERAKWERWFGLYRQLGLSSGEYLNLYDIAFDKPEVHVVRKGPDLYYGIFADYGAKNRRIELRGLERGTTYEVFDYANERALGTITGDKPWVAVAFKDNLLLRVRRTAK